MVYEKLVNSPSGYWPLRGIATPVFSKWWIVTIKVGHVNMTTVFAGHTGQRTTYHGHLDETET